jgi:hypothetical protein
MGDGALCLKLNPGNRAAWMLKRVPVPFFLLEGVEHIVVVVVVRIKVYRCNSHKREGNPQTAHFKIRQPPSKRKQVRNIRQPS